MEFTNWDEAQEWPERWLNWLLQTLKRDFHDQKFSRDFYNKLKQRNIHLPMVRDIIYDNGTYIARYWYGDGNRVGLWRPKDRLFVAWKPGSVLSPGRFMTVFRKADGIAYMQDFPPFREIRGPE